MSEVPFLFISKPGTLNLVLQSTVGENQLTPRLTYQHIKVHKFTKNLRRKETDRLINLNGVLPSYYNIFSSLFFGKFRVHNYLSPDLSFVLTLKKKNKDVDISFLPYFILSFVTSFSTFFPTSLTPSLSLNFSFIFVFLFVKWRLI